MLLALVALHDLAPAISTFSNLSKVANPNTFLPLLVQAYSDQGGSSVLLSIKFIACNIHHVTPVHYVYHMTALMQ